MTDKVPDVTLDRLHRLVNTVLILAVLHFSVEGVRLSRIDPDPIQLFAELLMFAAFLAIFVIAAKVYWPRYFPGIVSEVNGND